MKLLHIWNFVLILQACNVKTFNKPSTTLKSYTIDRVELKLPEYYSVYYPNDSFNPKEVYLLRGKQVALVGHFGSVGVFHNPEHYLDDSTIKYLDTINGALLVVSTSEDDYPYDLEKETENLIDIEFLDLRKLNFSVNEGDSFSQLHLLTFRKNWGYQMSVEERNELIKAVRKSNVRKE